ncbi:hypothetical protein O6H91_02G118500 [Diphasiastrum complanatum]|uniref:Uncharacterized protein n=1 Tax=Diphasiastrum complanatum TaxID=34168 RepID=A0ACC2EJW6_DIPCM|nr:hypothetical protein O6H91_02G118500 [Diphasiastrum complanatum]
MRADTALDCVFFQLDPTRSSRCELWVSAGGSTEKLATGSFKPFLAQLRVAQEQIAKGAYSVRLQVPSPPADGSSNSALWFSKGTLQRFVRFVSTPEILERLGTLDDEFKRLEEAIGILAAESIRGNDQTADKSTEIIALSGHYAVPRLNSDSANISVLSDDFEVSENTGDSSKKQLLRAMDSCRFMLLKEKQKAYTQALAAGFDAEYMADMLVFADTFGATRLRVACLNFIALSKENQLCRLSTLSQAESIGTSDSVLVSRTGNAFNGELDDIKNPVNQHVTFFDARNEESHSREHASNSNFAGLIILEKGSSPPPSGLRVPRAFYQSGSLISQPRHILVNGLKDSAQVGHSRDDQQTVSSQKETLPMGYIDNMNLLQTGKTKVNSVNIKTGCLSSEEETKWTTKTRRHSLEAASDSASAPFTYSSLPRRFVNNATSVTPELQERISYKPSPNRENSQGHPKEMQALTSGVRYAGRHPDWSNRDKYVPSPANSVQQHSHQIGAESSTSESGSSTLDPFPVDEVSDCSQMYIDTSYENSITKLPVQNNLLVPDSPSQCSVPQRLQIEENLLDRSPCAENKSLAKEGSNDSFMSKRSVRRSTSPRRRSSSPLRKVHINRSPARRPVVVIKNLSYSSPNSHDQSSTHKYPYRHPARTLKDTPTGDDTDSATESEEESHARKDGNRRLSVQAAISLFENRQKDSSSVQKKKLGKHDTLRKSAEPAKTVSCRKSVLRRSSGSNDASVESEQLSSNPGSAEDLDSSEDKPQMHDHKQMTEVKGQNFGASTWQSEPSLELHGLELLKQLRYESSVQLLERNMNTPQMRMLASSVHPDLGSVTKQQVFSTISKYSDAISSSSEQETQNDHRWSWVVSSQQSDSSVEKQKSEVHLGADLPAADTMKDKIVGEIGTQPIADFERHLVLGQSNLQRLEVPQNETRAHSPGQDLVKAFNAGEYRQHDELQVISIAEESSADWKASIDLQPEMQSYQLVSEELQESEERTHQQLSTGLVDGDSFIMSECHTGKGLLRRSWNTSSDYDMLSLLNAADSKVAQKPTEQATQESCSSGDQKGRFYEQYREKRDAKFRQESGTKRAEREAKLKAMQEVLERRKAELAARNMRSSVVKQSLSEEQWQSGKFYPPRNGLTNINKEKESGDKPRWEDHKQPQLLRVLQGSPTTAMVMQPATSTPRSLRQQTSNPTSSVARKLSPGSQKLLTTSSTPRSTARSLASSSPKSAPKSSTTTPSTCQRRPSNITEPCILDKALYRSMPSYPEPRKENTKPSSVRSGSLTQQETVLSSRGTKPKVSNTSRRQKHVVAVLPLESNGVMSSNTILQSSAIVEDTRPKALPVRKNISTVSELKAMQASVQEENILSPLKVSVKDLTAEPSPQNKAYKVHMAIMVPHEVKPFLRKGRGIGPGAGPGVLKLKATLAAEAAKMNDDDSLSKVEGTGPDDPETVSSSISENAPGMESSLDQNITELIQFNSSVLNHEEEATEVLNKPVESLPLPTSISDTEPSQQSSNMTGKFQQEQNALRQGPKSVFLSEAQHLTHEHSLARHSVSQEAESQALFCPAESLQQPSQDMSNSNYSSPLELSLSSSKSTLQQHMSINEDYPILASPSDMSLSHMLSPEHHSHRMSVGSSSPLASPASHGFPQLRYSLSPNIDSAKAEAVQSRKRWGNSHKLSVTNSQPVPKEAPKGFKRLLKFGRKSRSSGNSNSEWVSASTTSGEDDMDESSKDLASKSSEEIIRITASSLSHLRKSVDSVSKVSDTECVTGPASRSFFSLSAFRKQRS